MQDTGSDPAPSAGDVPIVPVDAVDGRPSRHQPFKVGLTATAALAALTACGPTTSSYTPPPYTPPPYTPPYTSYTPPPTTTTTTTPPPDTGSSGGGYSGGGYSSGGSSGSGDTITQPCLPTPVPAGYECACNCVPG